MTLENLLRDLLGDDLPIRVRAYDGTTLGPVDAAATIVITSPDALRRIFFAPGELGFSRAYVAGDLEVEGDILAALDLRDKLPDLQLRPRHLAAVAKLLGPSAFRPLPAPAEEVHLRGRFHSRSRDAAAIAHHYDFSNEAYAYMLGPSMAYSCAVYESPDDTLEQAQANKFELVCRKLDLQPGMRLLEIGGGWGGMSVHAATNFGVDVVMVTLSRNQADYSRKHVAELGLADRIDVRHGDYRDVTDGPFDAVSSIGMFEHVGHTQAARYMEHVHELTAPGARFLHHCITRPAFRRPVYQRAMYLSRYVFPDADLLEVGTIVSAVQAAGFEARHMESLRDHYGPTLRAWLANLEAHWDEIVGLVGSGRARVWRLYIAGSARNFEANRTAVHQILAVKPVDGRSAMPLRPTW